jgi:rhodanese-related sulfurtransferase
MTLVRLREFGDAWAAGDLDTLMSFMTDDCVYYASVGPEPGTMYRGPVEVRRGFSEMLAYDRGRERHGGHTFIAGNVGFAEWSFVQREPAGCTRIIRGCDIFEFAGEKIRNKNAFRKTFGEPRPPTEAGVAEERRSPVMAVPAADAADAAQHFRHKLAHETDCADVWKAIEAGNMDFLIVDCRPTPNYNKAHIPGAISLPWQEVTEERVRELPDLPIVTYCWGPSCNAATKGAHRLAALGRRVKEMIGGVEYWIREGHPTEGKRPVQRGEEGPTDWGLMC